MLPAGMLTDLVGSLFGKSFTDNHSCNELMSATVRSCIEDTSSQQPLPCSGFHILSTCSYIMFPESCGS